MGSSGDTFGVTLTLPLLSTVSPGVRSHGAGPGPGHWSLTTMTNQLSQVCIVKMINNLGGDHFAFNNLWK